MTLTICMGGIAVLAYIGLNTPWTMIFTKVNKVHIHDVLLAYDTMNFIKSTLGLHFKNNEDKEV